MSNPTSSSQPPRGPSSLAPPALDPETLDPSLELGLPDGAARRRPARPLGITPDGRLKSGRLAGLTLSRAIWVLSWPIALQSFLQSLVGLVDTVLAAGVSEAATDAIGGASYLIWFVGLVMMAIGVGATALISRAVGGRRLAVANAALGQAILLAAVSGVIVGGLVAAVAVPVSGLMGMTPDAQAAFQRFMLISAIGVPSMAVLYTGIECARAAGDSYRPLKSMVLVNIVNMAVSWSLAGVDLTSTRVVNGEVLTRTILHNPFPFHLGVTGIAIGTITAQTVGALVILRLLARGTSGIKLKQRRLTPHWHTMRRLLRVGLPNFLETLGMWAGNFLIVLMVGWLAASGTAGAHGGGGLLGSHIIAIRIEAFSFMPGFAMGVAAAALAGQYLGAGSPALARRATLVCTAIAAAFMGVVGLLFVFTPGAITGLLTSQPTHLEQVPTLLLITGIVQVPFAIGIVLRSAMRGAGDVRVVMILTWATTYAVRLPLAYAISGVEIPLPASLGGGVIHNPFWSSGAGGLPGLWIGLTIEVVIRALLFGARFIQGGWLTMRV